MKKPTKARRPKRTKKPRAVGRPKATKRRKPARAVKRVSRAPAGGRLAADVATALRSAGYDPPDSRIVATLTAVAAGYRKGPAPDPPFPVATDIDAEVAGELVHRFAEGDRSPLPELKMHRPTVRATVDFNLDQLGLGGAGDVVRATLTSLCLGSWDPAADEVARRNALAGFFVRWYRDGLA